MEPESTQELTQELTHYQILGITNLATQAEIKTAFKTMSQKYHPDKQKGNEEHYKRIRKAYKILSSLKSRVIYDSGMKNNFNSEQVENVVQALSLKHANSVVEQAIQEYVDPLDLFRQLLINEKKEKEKQVFHYEKQMKKAFSKLAKIKNIENSYFAKALEKKQIELRGFLHEAQLVSISVDIILVEIKEGTFEFEKEEENKQEKRKRLFSQSDFTGWK